MKEKNLNNAIYGAFVADAYALAAHWVYDEAKVKALPIDWQNFNDPQAMWHSTKKSGDFTHHGDQMHMTLASLGQTKKFDLGQLEQDWQKNMRAYKGYIDGATRDTLKNYDNDMPSPKGSNSDDLGACGRIAPLLLVKTSDDAFFEQAKQLTAMTHNAPLPLQATAYFAQVLLAVLNGMPVVTALKNCGEHFADLQKWINEGLASKDADTLATIRKFGPACGVDEGFGGVIHLLALEENYETTMIKNARAGGDNTSRGMIVGMILGASGAEIPARWFEQMKQYATIKELLATFA